MSLRIKLILGLALIESLFLVVITLSMLNFVATSGRTQLVRHARVSVTLMAAAAETDILADDVGGLQALVQEVLAHRGAAFVRIIDRDGVVLAQGGERQALKAPFHKGYVKRHGNLLFFEVTKGVVVAGVRYGTVEMGLSTRPLTRRLAQARLRMIDIAAAEMILAILFAFYFGGYLGAKLQLLEDAAAFVGEGHLGYQVPVIGRDEISRTLIAFNKMSQRLREEMDERQRQDKKLKELAATLEERVAQRTLELADANDALQHLALHDPLCNLPNRNMFTRELDRILSTSRHASESFAVAVLDLDHFKAVNDRHGHEGGDELLRVVGRRLREAVRASDVVARFGGDEFAMVLPNLRGGIDALTCIAQKLRAALSAPVTIGGEIYSPKASLGFALFPDQGNDAISLTRNADIAMYWAKRHKSGFCFYGPDIELEHSETAASPAHEERFRLALANQEFVLHYQPILSLTRNTIESAEALVRWQHPDEGLLPPSLFVPRLERTALMEPFTLYILDRAIKDRTAFGFAALTIAINISAVNVLSEAFPDRVAERLLQGAAAGLTFELTESALVDNTGRAAQTITRLRAMGVTAAIDDFGTGYASIGYLRNLPLDVVKIDRSLIAAMQVSENEREIVRTIIALCHQLGYRVVAEGVEDSPLLGVLKDFGCDYAQGYAIARPMPADALPTWLRDWGR